MAQLQVAAIRSLSEVELKEMTLVDSEAIAEIPYDAGQSILLVRFVGGEWTPTSMCLPMCTERSWRPSHMVASSRITSADTIGIVAGARPESGPGDGLGPIPRFLDGVQLSDQRVHAARQLIQERHLMPGAAIAFGH